mgnify:CR=1 FL=1
MKGFGLFNTTEDKSFARPVILLLMVTLTLSLAFLPGKAYASSSDHITGIYDYAGLLSDSEEASLSRTMAKYAAKYDSDIVIVTQSDTGGLTAREYADKYAEDIGMSMQESGPAGILFLIDMYNREIYIATQGQAIACYTDSRIEKVLDNCYNKIIDGDYAGCCEKFLKGVRDYMGRSANKGARMDLMGVLIRLLISMGLGGLLTGAMARRAGGTVTAGAVNYFNAAAAHTGNVQDRFVNRTVTRRRIVRDNDNGGGGRPSGGGGGGGVHTSSRGGVHGGGGRKF